MHFFERILQDVYQGCDNDIVIRGKRVREVTDYSYRVNPYDVIYTNEYRNTPMDYLAGELLWYLNGYNDIGFIKHFSKFWDKIKNDDGTINSAYGNLIFNTPKDGKMASFVWAYNSLKADKYTRQAIIHFNTPSYNNPETKDYPCTIYGCYQIRPFNGKDELALSISMRSQDVFKGATFDVPFFSFLLQQMYLWLLPDMPDLVLGKLTMHINSLHIYESDFETAEKMLDSNIESGVEFKLDKSLMDICPIKNSALVYFDIFKLSQALASDFSNKNTAVTKEVTYPNVSDSTFFNTFMKEPALNKLTQFLLNDVKLLTRS